MRSRSHTLCLAHTHSLCKLHARPSVLGAHEAGRSSSHAHFCGLIERPFGSFRHLPPHPRLANLRAPTCAFRCVPAPSFPEPCSRSAFALRPGESALEARGLPRKR
eukprot:1978905-Pleurochrysis_carterae.AAC.1